MEKSTAIVDTTRGDCHCVFVAVSLLVFLGILSTFCCTKCYTCAPREGAIGLRIDAQVRTESPRLGLGVCSVCTGVSMCACM